MDHKFISQKKIQPLFKFFKIFNGTLDKILGMVFYLIDFSVF